MPPKELADAPYLGEEVLLTLVGAEYRHPGAGVALKREVALQGRDEGRLVAVLVALRVLELIRHSIGQLQNKEAQKKIPPRTVEDTWVRSTPRISRGSHWKSTDPGV